MRFSIAIIVMKINPQEKSLCKKDENNFPHVPNFLRTKIIATTDAPVKVISVDKLSELLCLWKMKH